MAKERARTLTLRAVADLLVERGYAGRRDTNGHNKLLALLKCGDLQSVAFFPDVTESPVCLPVEYWAPVGPDALLVLLRQPARRHRGAYKIELRDLAVEVFRVARSSENLDVESLVARLIENAETEANVEVLQSNWDEFAASHPPGTGSRGAGRPEKNWEDAYAELAALLWLAVEQKSDPPSQESLARDIAVHLRAAGAENSPTAKTIQGRFSSIRRRVEALKLERGKKNV